MGVSSETIGSGTALPVVPPYDEAGTAGAEGLGRYGEEWEGGHSKRCPKRRALLLEQLKGIPLCHKAGINTEHKDIHAGYDERRDVKRVK